MCGIAGAVWNEPEAALPPEVLQQMVHSLRHRGPDDEGTYRSEFQMRQARPGLLGVGLGFRRLSIIDLAGGHQPLCNEDQSVWVVFNGEIYNYPQLRARLEGSGHTFRTESDTETLVHLYEDEGLDFVRLLNGMFALAIWDAKRGQLLLARDRLGQKPLCYRLETKRLLFGSELKALLQVPDVPREIDPTALDAYLTYQYVPHPQSILRGVRKLPPGHLAVYREGKLEVRRYWTPDFATELSLGPQEAQERFEQHLQTAVRMRLRSDVPLGAFLSGGIDSSLICSFAQQELDRPLHTFSMGFSDPEYDETAYAVQTAQHLGTEHHEFRIDHSVVPEVMPKLAWHYDEPFGDSSAIPTYFLSKYTREYVTVALTGDGGDELFAGYPRYSANRVGAWFDRLPEGLKWLATWQLWQRLPSGTRQRSYLRRAKRLLKHLAESPIRRHVQWISIFDEARRAVFYEDDWLAQLPDADPVDFLTAAFEQIKGRDPLTAASLADLNTYLPCDLMTKIDIASMAHALECRSPFLDFHLVEFVAQLPMRYKMPRWQGKWLLKQVAQTRLPEEIIQRRKQGFGVPLEPWFRGPLREWMREILLDPQTLQRGFFRPAAIEQLLSEHDAGQYDHSARIWALLSFENWVRQWYSRPTTPADDRSLSQSQRAAAD